MMKSLYKNLIYFPALFVLASCTSEAPFSIEGESLVKMNLSISSNLTRASEGQDYNTLLNECNIYISDNYGVLYKWEGISNIPAQGIYMKQGNYFAEAWTGEMDEPSFTDKFYWGKTPFSIGSNEVNTQVSIECKLSDIVASVDPTGLDETIVESLKISFTTSKGTMELSGTTLSEKVYFPPVFNSDNEPEGEVLTYKVTGKYLNGEEIEITGSENGLPGHEYQIYFDNQGGEPLEGGGVHFQILVREYELEVNDEITVHTAPRFSWMKDATGNQINVGDQFISMDNSFVSQTLLVAAYKEFKNLTLTSSNVPGFNKIISLMSDGDAQELGEKGVKILKEFFSNNICQYRITLSDYWLNSLSANKECYEIEVTAEDISGKISTAKIRIANTEDAMDSPFKIDENHWNTYPMSLGIDWVDIPVSYIRKGNLGTVYIQYRQKGETEWQTEEVSSKNVYPGSSVSKDMVSFTNLFRGEDGNGGIEYECRVVGGNYLDERYQYESPISTFVTESKFEIPNSSMEEWSTNSDFSSNVIIPNANGVRSFWDSGNHGSATLKVTLTDRSDIKHSGNYGACLTSKFVAITGNLGKFGAGNLFVGEYAGTTGTNGKINFGRSYNNSHPKKLKLFVNYRPKNAVNNKGANNKYIPAGSSDKSQIYIALSTEVKKVDTSNTSTLVTEDQLPDSFIAYGQKTFEQDFGEEGKLEEIEIDLEYFEKAYTIQPKYLIIVCSASKFGDYFSGGDGSTMYVDDFELIY